MSINCLWRPCCQLCQLTAHPISFLHTCVEALQMLVLLQVFSTYRFTFDHVYAHDAAQADVYMNSARESVLNALQVTHLVCCAVLSVCDMLTNHSQGCCAYHQ